MAGDGSTCRSLSPSWDPRAGRGRRVDSLRAGRRGLASDGRWKASGNGTKPRFPLKGSFKGDIDTDLDVDVDIDSYPGKLVAHNLELPCPNYGYFWL